MEVKAIGKYVKVQPRKVRIIADQVRGKSAMYTSSLLRYHPSKSARLLRKVLMSAVANATEKGLSAESLRITSIVVDEGPRLKRLQARAMGRGNRIIKKTSHITVVVEEGAPMSKPKPHGTKAKPRPTLADVKGKKKVAAKKESAETEAAIAEVVAEEAAPQEATEAPTQAQEAPVEEAPEAQASTEAGEGKESGEETSSKENE